MKWEGSRWVVCCAMPVRSQREGRNRCVEVDACTKMTAELQSDVIDGKERRGEAREDMRKLGRSVQQSVYGGRENVETTKNEAGSGKSDSGSQNDRRKARFAAGTESQTVQRVWMAFGRRRK